jgi:hypothetical protein
MRNILKSLPALAGAHFTLMTSRALAVDSSGVAPGAAVPSTLNPSGDLNQVRPTGASTDLLTNIRVITNTLILGVGIVAVLMLIIGGFRYVFSQGNEKAVTGAKDTIVYAIIGIIVALVAFAAVNFVLSQFTQTPANT